MKEGDSLILQSAGGRLWRSNDAEIHRIVMTCALDLSQRAANRFTAIFMMATHDQDASIENREKLMKARPTMWSPALTDCYTVGCRKRPADKPTDAQRLGQTRDDCIEILVQLARHCAPGEMDESVEAGQLPLDTLGLVGVPRKQRGQSTLC